MHRQAALIATCLLSVASQATEIVSNLTEPYNFGAGLGGVWVEASSFTTGAASYYLNGITLDLQVNSPSTVALSLFNDSGGLPGTPVEDLGTQFINANGGDYDTVYPASGATLLQANTRYWLVVEQVGAGSTSWVSTYSTAETSPSGVTIGNDMYYHSVGGGAWTAQAGATDTGQFAVNATSSGPVGVPAVLISDHESGNTKFFTGIGADYGWSTATWAWNGSVLTQTGGTFYTTRRIASNPGAPSLETHQIEGLVINTGASTVTAAIFQCLEGSFGQAIEHLICGTIGYGQNGTLQSSVEYNYGGNANCIHKVIGGDDVDAGPIRGLNTHGVAGSCAAQTGIYERYTVSLSGGTLTLSNGIPINTEGSIWMTFGLDSDSDGILDSSDNCTLVPNNEAGTVPNSGVLKSQLDSDDDDYGNACDGDLNNTGLTSVSDNTILRNHLNQLASASAIVAAADLNGSGTVTATDTTLLRNRLNTPPGPSGYGCGQPAGFSPCP